MYQMYAADPRARLNLGIRRRLAPLMENDLGRIELMNSLLLSMPGSPIIYYGDEIGMGDNIYLGDRNGVRTPMQWSPDRNAGFSRADPQRLYLPPIMDPVYGYEAVNVEAQLREPSSLLQLDAAHARRAQDAARPSAAARFAFLQPGQPQDPRVPARVRRRSDPVRRQPVARPRSRSSSTSRASRAACRSSARPHAVPADRRAAVPADAAGLRLLLVPARRRRRCRRLARGAAAGARTAGAGAVRRLEQLLPRRAWCRGASAWRRRRGAARDANCCRATSTRSAGTRRRAEPRRRVRRSPTMAQSATRANSWLLTLARCRTARGEPQRYFVPLALAWEDATRSALRRLGAAAVAKVRQQASVGRARRRDCRRGLLPRAGRARSARARANSRPRTAASRSRRTRAFARAGRRCHRRPDAAAPAQPHSSNTGSALGERLFLKVYRRLRAA